MADQSRRSIFKLSMNEFLSAEAIYGERNSVRNFGDRQLLKLGVSDPRWALIGSMLPNISHIVFDSTFSKIVHEDGNVTLEYSGSVELKKNHQNFVHWMQILDECLNAYKRQQTAGSKRRDNPPPGIKNNGGSLPAKPRHNVTLSDEQNVRSEPALQAIVDQLKDPNVLTLEEVLAPDFVGEVEDLRSESEKEEELRWKKQADVITIEDLQSRDFKPEVVDLFDNKERLRSYFPSDSE